MGKFDDVSGLLLAADLSVTEARKRLSGGLLGSPQDSAKKELATAMQAIEMARYHLTKSEKET